MPNENLEFELFLRQFEPVIPDPLPLPQLQHRRWFRLISTAVAGGLVGLTLWHVSRTNQPHQTAEPHIVHQVSPTLGSMVRLAGTPELDSTLGAQSAILLPNVKNSGGALAVLAKP